MCAFMCDSSTRILDFLNLTFPELRRRLAEHGQQLRAGLILDSFTWPQVALPEDCGTLTNLGYEPPDSSCRGARPDSLRRVLSTKCSHLTSRTCSRTR